MAAKTATVRRKDQAELRGERPPSTIFPIPDFVLTLSPYVCLSDNFGYDVLNQTFCWSSADMPKYGHDSAHFDLFFDRSIIWSAPRSLPNWSGENRVPKAAFDHIRRDLSILLLSNLHNDRQFFKKNYNGQNLPILIWKSVRLRTKIWRLRTKICPVKSRWTYSKQHANGMPWE